MKRGKLDVLLVEEPEKDEESLKELFRDKCKRSFHCMTAPSLHEGIRVLKENDFDLIFLDLELPDARGVEALEKMNAHSPIIPIVVITGAKNQGEALKALNWGAQDFLIRGHFDANTLERVVRYSMERSRYLKGIWDREKALEDLNAQLNEALKKAEHASLAKSRFLAKMSHEIRTPLNTIIGLTELFSETELNQQQRYYVDIFRKSGNHLLQLLDNVLDLSRIEAGEFKLNTEAMDLNGLLEELADWAGVSCRFKGLEFFFFLDPSVQLSIYADSKRLRQVVFNLISNAIKFTEKGYIFLSVDLLSPNTSDDQERLLFRVQDTGIGIPEEKREQIFEDFTQADDTITRRYGGTGLGLTITRQIVEIMGGGVAIHSKINCGSEFRVHLPVPMQEENQFCLKDHALSLAGRKIALLLNHPSEVKILNEYLKVCQNPEVFIFSTMEDLNASMEKQNQTFDFMMTDCCEEIDEIEYLLKTVSSIRERVIFLVQPAPKNDELQILEDRGIAYYVAKPIKFKRLMEVISQIIHSAESLKPQPVEKKGEMPDEATPLSVLLAEDVEDNRFLMGAYLKGSAYRLDYAENGEEAIQKFLTHQYDVILMDIQMPVLDGLTAIERIRHWERQEEKKSTPIIAISAHALSEEIKKAMTAGCNQYLTKPIRKKEVLDVLRELVQKYPKTG